MCTVPILILLKKKLCKDDLAHTLNVSGYILDEEIIQGEISRKLVNVNVVWFMNVESNRGICKAKETDGWRFDSCSEIFSHSYEKKKEKNKR